MMLATALVVPVAALLGSAQPPATVGGSLVEQIACAPTSPAAPPPAGMRVVGGSQHGRIMFGPGESLIVNAGSHQGIQNGQVFYVRRLVDDHFSTGPDELQPLSVHTAGWVTIVDARDDLSVAQVTHACDGVLVDDYLEAYSAPVVPDAVAGGAPDFEHPARIMLADQKRQAGAEGSLMIIDRGIDAGIRAGQTATLYRPSLAGAGPRIEVGTGTVLVVSPKTSLLRVDTTHDAVYLGDLAAIRRLP